MAWIRKDKKAERLYALYKAGMSLSEIAEKEGCTRQSVFGLFAYRGWKMRSPVSLCGVYFNGGYYTMRNNGYLGKTTGERTLLHRDVWELHNGEIPRGFDIHHKDGDRTNNAITNLECLSKSEHTRLYSPHHNQYTKREKCGSSART